MQQADREVSGMMHKHKTTILSDDGLVKDLLTMLREKKRVDDADREYAAIAAAKIAAKNASKD